MDHLGKHRQIMAIVMNPLHRLLPMGRSGLVDGGLTPSTQVLPTLQDVMALPDARGVAGSECPDEPSARSGRRCNPNGRPSAAGILGHAVKRVAAWIGTGPRVEEAAAEEAPARRAPAQRRTSQRRFKALLTAPLRAIAQIIFLDVKLKREGKTLHILLAARPPAIKKRRSRLDKAIAEAEPLRRALKAFLDLHPMTRRMLRHLGYLERALGTQGVKAFADVPVEVLEVSLAQLESIVTNWSDRDLADLRSRLAVAVKDRLRDEFGADGQRSEFMTASRLLVGDVPHSEFAELERQYQGLVSQETIQAALEAIRTPSPDESQALTAHSVMAPGDGSAEQPFPIPNAEWAGRATNEAEPVAMRRAH